MRGFGGKRERKRHSELLRTCYEVAYLEGKRRARMRLRADEQQRLQRALAETDAVGHRRHPRVNVRLAAVVKLQARTLKATVVDLSAGGLCFETDVGLPVGKRILVKMESADHSQFTFSARVLRVSEGKRHRIAAVFEGIPLELRRQAADESLSSSVASLNVKAAAAR